MLKAAQDEAQRGALIYSRDTSPMSASSKEYLHETELHFPRAKRSKCSCRNIAFALVILFCTLLGFAFGMVTSNLYSLNNSSGPLRAVRAQISLSSISREFQYLTDLSKEPPTGGRSGDVPEPAWDALIPNGLGYFQDPDIAPQISIPTVFHQLHCLYLIRRAYYSNQPANLSGQLEHFDFGRPRAPHVAHCFDYLQQGLTCSADSTVEPAITKEHGFLGSGFERKCKDYEGLKTFVQQRRVFEAEGFLAKGLDEGHLAHDAPNTSDGHQPNRL